MLAEAPRRAVTPRRFHAYGIGNGKTGTHSLAAMFATHFRSRHEPGAQRLIAMTGRLLSGVITQAQLEHWLLARDRHLDLELEVSFLTGRFATTLARLFSQAKFVLTLREPFSWLESTINQSLVPNDGDHWPRNRIHTYGPLPEHYPPQETWLKDRGLYPLATYIGRWSTHNLAMMDALPADRLLVIRLRELATRTEELAAFVGVGAEQLDLSRSHEFKASGGFRLLEIMDVDHIRQEILREGRPLLQRYFPRVLSQLDR